MGVFNGIERTAKAGDKTAAWAVEAGGGV